MIRGFPPIAGPDARVLVLGTCPSRASLEAERYYAHTRNAFWPIIERLFAEESQLDYDARADLLMEHRIALWDVLHAAERVTSLDSDIVRGSEVPNDVAGFLRDHPSIHAVFFNGGMAEAFFRRHVLGGAGGNPLGDARIAGLRYVRLPSTSPAHAGMSVDAKCEAWSVLARVVRDSER